MRLTPIVLLGFSLTLHAAPLGAIPLLPGGVPSVLGTNETDIPTPTAFLPEPTRMRDRDGMHAFGQMFGATNSRGEYPVERPISRNDLWAMAYQPLRIDFTRSFPDHQGRLMPILPFGDTIEELLPDKSV